MWEDGAIFNKWSILDTADGIVSILLVHQLAHVPVAVEMNHEVFSNHTT
jgi:hypothetical protein